MPWSIGKGAMRAVFVIVGAVAVAACARVPTGRASWLLPVRKRRWSSFRWTIGSASNPLPGKSEMEARRGAHPASLRYDLHAVHVRQGPPDSGPGRTTRLHVVVECRPYYGASIAWHHGYLGVVGIKLKMRPMERATYTSALLAKKLRGLCVCADAIYGNAASRRSAY